MPISKQRNKHLQTVLVEAAKLSQHFNDDLTRLHEKALEPRRSPKTGQ
jgi:hypothetical protein